MPRLRGMGAWGLNRRRCSARALPTQPTTQPRPGSAKGTEPRSVPARRCARKPQRVNPQTRTASARAGAGGERTYNASVIRRWGGAVASRSCGMRRQTGAPTRGLRAARPRRGPRPPPSMSPQAQRSGGAEPPLLPRRSAFAKAGPRSLRRPSCVETSGVIPKLRQKVCRLFGARFSFRGLTPTRLTPTRPNRIQRNSFLFFKG